MKKAIFTVTTVLIIMNLLGQKNEYRLGFNSGLFSFSGKSSEAVSFINHDEQWNFAYTNNPYGSQQALCYGVSGNWKRVLKSKVFYGFDLGYERLRSKVTITEVSGYNGTSTFQHNAKGKTFLNLDYINLHPFFGYRFLLKSLHFDISGGLDVGYCLRIKERGNATLADGAKFKTSSSRKTISTDFRPRLQLASEYKKFGVYVGYSFGQTNYRSGYIGGVNECYARLLRFGTTYRFN